MGHHTNNNVLAIAENTRNGFKYTIAGVRSRGWLEFNVRRYNYLWVVENHLSLDLPIDRCYFGLSGTFTGAALNARKYEIETGNKHVLHKIHFCR